MLETSTLALLLERQSATILTLCVTRYSEPQDASSLLVGGLESLEISDLNVEQTCEWPARLIALNCHTLRYLTLGVMSKVARNYAIHPDPIQIELPTSFAEWASVELSASEQEIDGGMPTVSLDALSLYGLNLKKVVGGTIGLEIDFSTLTALELNSCSGLDEAFALFMGHDGAQKTKLGALKGFYLRHEDGSPGFAQCLTDFLTSLVGLNHLSILLDRCSGVIYQEQILGGHKKTLRTFVWDERSGPRNDARSDTSLVQKGLLKHVSLGCPNLEALGLSIDWPNIAKSSTGIYATVISLHPLHWLSGRMRTDPSTSSAESFKG